MYACAASEGFEVKSYVDPQGCIDCGACVPVCTSDSIKPTEDLTEEQQGFIAANTAFFVK